MIAQRIAVVGAGPAGLVAAIAGRRLGLDVTLFEQAADFKRVGGGVMMHSNGQRVLAALGLLESFRPRMRMFHRLVGEAPLGRVHSEIDYRTIDVPHNAAAVVLRFQLQEHLLAGAAREGIEVRFGHRLTDASLDATGATLRFQDDSTGRFDVVVAADGLHSRVSEAAGIERRESAVGEAYIRCVATRRTDGDAIREIWCPDGRRFGICPLPGDETYLFCSVPLGLWRDMSVTARQSWVGSWEPELASLLGAVPDLGAAVYDELRKVTVNRWWKGRVFVIGDAAHAMPPNLGQGANSSMVDALVLMRILHGALAGDGDLEAAGRSYDELRRPFVRRIQKAADQMGALAAWKSAPARWLRSKMVPLMVRSQSLQQMTNALLSGNHPAEAAYLQPL